MIIEKKLNKTTFKIENNFIDLEVNSIFNKWKKLFEHYKTTNIISKNTYILLKNSLEKKWAYPLLTSVLSCLIEDDKKTQQQAIIFLANNVILFDLLDDIADKAEIRNVNIFKEIYFEALVDPFRKIKRFNGVKQLDNMYPGLSLVIQTIISASVLDYPNQNNLSETKKKEVLLLKKKAFSEILYCAHMQFIASSKNKDRKRNSNKLLGRKIIKNNLSILKNLKIQNNNHFANLQIIFNTPLGAFIYSLLTLKIITQKNFNLTKKTKLDLEKTIMLLKIINVAGDQLSDLKKDQETGDWSYILDLGINFEQYNFIINKFHKITKYKTNSFYKPIIKLKTYLVLYYYQFFPVSAKKYLL